jgi:hypothetical protein
MGIVGEGCIYYIRFVFALRRERWRIHLPFIPNRKLSRLGNMGVK